jgi:hypothetical protein
MKIKGFISLTYPQTTYSPWRYAENELEIMFGIPEGRIQG